MSCFLLYPNDTNEQKNIEWIRSLFPMKGGNRLPFSLPSLVIQWGNGGLSGNQRGTVVLNGSEAYQHATRPLYRDRILMLNGIPVASALKQDEGIPTLRRYFAFVFQQEVLGLFRSSGNQIWMHHRPPEGDEDYEEIEQDLKNREIRKIIHYSIRSIYALGLDFGGVFIGVNQQGKMRVLDIRPTVNLNEVLARRFVKSVQRFFKTYFILHPEQVMLGADPEFILKDEKGELVMASQFFPRRGMVGCDQVVHRGEELQTQYPLAELRPPPADDPEKLFKNIYIAMVLGARKINNPDIHWLAGGMPLEGYPIGGHIHFSRIELNSQFLRVLDNYLALPLSILENEQSRKRRPRYGYLGDFRRQFHGGFEYRTLPSWLISPVVARGVLALSKLLALHYKHLRKLPLQDIHIQEAFYHGKKEELYELLPGLWRDIESLPSYYRYAKLLNPFKQLLLEGEEWNEMEDIRQGWKLPESIGML
jgi:hypothetical protein